MSKREESNSIFTYVFYIFSKASNEEFHSLVQQYSYLCDEGKEYDCNWLLNTFITKYK